MNPLFNAIFGTKQGQIPHGNSQTQNQPAGDWNALMGQLQANPAAMIQNAGFQVPDEIAGNPQATVMHLINSGQVSGPVMNMIRPMLNRMGVR